MAAAFRAAGQLPCDCPFFVREEAAMQELMRARGCYEAGDWRQAEEWYRRVLEADPHNGEALQRLGIMALQAKDPAAAAEWLQKAAEVGSRDALLYSHLGVARAKMKQFDQAIACFEQAVKLDPRSAETHYNWGNALSALGRPEEAIEKFRAAAANMPDSPDTRCASCFVWKTSRLTSKVVEFPVFFRCA
jgi:tetratricopeptide (TPR) repeat protein